MKYLWLGLAIFFLIVGIVQTNPVLSVFAGQIALFLLIVHYGQKLK